MQTWSIRLFEGLTLNILYSLYNAFQFLGDLAFLIYIFSLSCHSKLSLEISKFLLIFNFLCSIIAGVWILCFIGWWSIMWDAARVLLSLLIFFGSLHHSLFSSLFLKILFLYFFPHLLIFSIFSFYHINHIFPMNIVYFSYT